MKNRWLGLSLLFIMLSATAWAEQDFYGVRIKNEAWARFLVLKETVPMDEEETHSSDIVDQNIHAEAQLKEIEDGHIGFRVTVFNDSAAAIPTDYRLRDFLVYTRDGKKYSLIDNEESLPPFIDPRSKMSFSPSFGNLAVRNADIEMVVCSFDLGKTRVILFPWSKKELVSKLTNPGPPVEAQQTVKEDKKSRKTGELKKTPKRNFWDWMALEKKHKTPADLKRAPVMPTAVEPAPLAAAPAGRAPEGDVSPATRQKLDSAIQNFVYTPAGQETGSPSSNVGPAVPVRDEARVVSFNKDYNFITLNLGEQDGLRNGMMLSIVRDGKLVAKAKVKQVREAVSAATLVPESIRSEVRTGDAVAFV